MTYHNPRKKVVHWCAVRYHKWTLSYVTLCGHFRVADIAGGGRVGSSWNWGNVNTRKAKRGHVTCKSCLRLLAAEAGR